jgi:hypothetical protein
MSNQPTKKISYWKRVWEKHPEAMAENLKRLNESRRAKASERMKLLQAILPQLPIGAMTSTELRDAVREAWSSNYGEDLSKHAAWNIARTARDSGIIQPPAPNGTYTIHVLPSSD